MSYSQDSVKSRMQYQQTECRVIENITLAHNEINSLLQYMRQFERNKLLEIIINRVTKIAKIISQTSDDLQRRPNERQEINAQIQIRKLTEENEKLNKQIELLNVNNEDLTNRISKIMCVQEKNRTDPHYNLMDENPPSAILAQFRDLYTEEYGHLSAELSDNGWEEKQIAQDLISILKAAMLDTKEFVHKAKTDAIQKLEAVFKERLFDNSFTIKELPKHWLDDICTILRHSTNKEKLKVLQNDLRGKYNRNRLEGNIRDHLYSYVDKCVEVTWLMNASHPAMYIHFEDGPDVDYNPKRHARFAGRGDKVDYFLWPCVYFTHEEFRRDGNVMAKADVVLKKIDVPNAGPGLESDNCINPKRHTERSVAASIPMVYSDGSGAIDGSHTILKETTSLLYPHPLPYKYDSSQSRVSENEERITKQNMYSR